MINRPLFKEVFSQIMFCAGLVILCGATGLAQNQAPANAEAAAPAQASAQRTDGEIEMDVVHALDASQELKNDLITAATIEGEVTLSGSVSSKASSDKAESIARQVAGVTKVNNNLKIGNPQEAQGDNGVPPMAGGEQENGPQGYAQQGPPPDQGQEPYPSQQPQYGNQQPQEPAYAVATGPVTIPQGTLIQLRTSEPVNS